MRLAKAAWIAAVAIATAAPSFPQAVAAWFDRAPEAVPYASIEGNAAAAALLLRDAGLTDAPLAERLAEGARKRVEPGRLAAAISEDAARLAEFAGLLATRGLLPARAELAGAIASRASLVLRAGCDLALIGASLEGARGPEDVERGLAAAAAVASIRARFPLGEPEAAALAAAAARGRVPTNRLDSLLGIFARYRAYGLTSARIVETCVDALEAGGGLDRLERELQRRTRTP